MKLPLQINEILTRIESAGFEAYIVGGCVRDSIMGKSPHDYDIASSALPRDIKNIFSGFRVIETGIKHGTVTVLFKGAGVEITTFRVDGKYSDGRHPDSVSFSRNIEDDLSRRDFTVNGIAYNPERGLIDPFGGREDIEAGIIRCIGDPDKRFSEDALRILRALRFSSVLDFKIEQNTAHSLSEHKSDLQRVSAERIFAELKKLLCGSSVKRIMLDFPEIFAEILPPLGEQTGYDQGSKYHNSTLYEHTARTVEAAPPDIVMRLAMLLHDIGKPYCRTSDENGECHYYGHAERGAQIAEELLRKLKCDNATRERVTEIVRYHDIPLELSEKKIKKQLSKYGAELFFDIVNAHIADDSAKYDFCRERLPKWREIAVIAERITAEQPCLTLKELAVDGRDLKAIMPPSPEMGKLLRALLAEVIDGTLQNDKSALLQRAEQLLTGN